jgi:hypothetical protein
MPAPLPVNDAIMLHFDWKDVDGEVIKAVLGQPCYYEEGDGVSWWRTAIVLKHAAIMIDVNNDTDEIVVTLERGELPRGEAPLDEAWIPLEALSSLVGRKLGWSWNACNSRGYLDAFMIAVDGIDPDWMFVGIASRVPIRKIELVTL